MGLLSTILDVVLNRPRGITGKGLPRGDAKEGQFGPTDAPGEGDAADASAVGVPEDGEAAPEATLES